MATTSENAPVRYRDGLAIIDLPRQIDSSAERALTGAYDEASGRGANKVLLNFGAVQFLSSTGIALIVGILARARKESRAISSCGLSDHYREIFEITRLADFMRIFPDESSAVAEHGQ